MSLSGCSCWLAKGDGAVGKDGALSSCVHSSIVLSSRLLAYSVKMSAIVNKSISFELTICFCYWHYFRSKFPLFLFGKHNFHSFSSQFGNCLGSSEFSLKCIAASSNLKSTFINGYMYLFKLAYLQCIPTYENPSSLGAKWLTTAW